MQRITAENDMFRYMADISFVSGIIMWKRKKMAGIFSGQNPRKRVCIFVPNRQAVICQLTKLMIAEAGQKISRTEAGYLLGRPALTAQ